MTRGKLPPALTNSGRTAARDADDDGDDEDYLGLSRRHPLQKSAKRTAGDKRGAARAGSGKLGAQLRGVGKARIGMGMVDGRMVDGDSAEDEESDEMDSDEDEDEDDDDSDEEDGDDNEDDDDEKEEEGAQRHRPGGLRKGGKAVEAGGGAGCEYGWLQSVDESEGARSMAPITTTRKHKCRRTRAQSKQTHKIAPSTVPAKVGRSIAWGIQVLRINCPI